MPINTTLTMKALTTEFDYDVTLDSLDCMPSAWKSHIQTISLQAISSNEVQGYDNIIS